MRLADQPPLLVYTYIHRKYEHSKTFGLIAAASANVVWSPDENAPITGSRSTGAGRAVVGADEEVLCWDVKKGELLDRWKDKHCRAEVTVVSRSKVEPDIYAAGYVELYTIIGQGAYANASW